MGICFEIADIVKQTKTNYRGDYIYVWKTYLEFTFGF